MASENYRYYSVDQARHLHDADWFYADSDADAVARIIASHPDSQSEVWHGVRLVASIKPGWRSA